MHLCLVLCWSVCIIDMVSAYQEFAVLLLDFILIVPSCYVLWISVMHLNFASEIGHLCLCLV